MNKMSIIAAGGLVVNEKNEILLIFRRGVWDLPKGKLDKGENIEQCALREVQEETGLQKIAITQFLTKTFHEYFDKYLQETVIKESHWYLMKAIGNEVLIPQIEEDITEIKWVSKEGLKACMQNTYSTIQDVIQAFFSTQLP